MRRYDVAAGFAESTDVIGVGTGTPTGSNEWSRDHEVSGGGQEAATPQLLLPPAGCTPRKLTKLATSSKLRRLGFRTGRQWQG